MQEQNELIKELIVDVQPQEVSIALLENHRLIELDRESAQGHSYSVGDVYLGKVRKLLPALNAAFVDIGDEKDAFVHLPDLGNNFFAFDEFVKTLNPNTDHRSIYSHIKLGARSVDRDGKIQDYLQAGQPIIVQITKEPISTKGSRLTAEISLAGRNVVLLPFAQKVSVSSKITTKEEKKRLELVVKNILPKNYGAIIRTAAEGKTAAVLDAELTSLIRKWEESFKKIARSKDVQMLFSEYSRTTTVLRDLLNDSFENIYSNDERVCQDIRTYLSLIAPDKEKIVSHYTGKEPIFDHFDITRQIKGSFGKVVPLKQGAYLVIEHTEALHVVDVNSGTRAKNKEQEQNTFDVNCYAAEEIVRQMRLRDMGGIVIVDFIDMETGEHRNQLYKYVQDLMEGDRAKHTVLPLTKFGLMQITRQRVRPVSEINTEEVCPVCHGTGKITSSIIVDEAIERKLSDLVSQGYKNLGLTVGPILGAYLSKGLLNSILQKWKRKYKCRITLTENSQYSVLQYDFYSEKGKKL
ncbi:MAG: Rne/Rng family ribonuclease [Bacteroidales bacterium]|nr:Rne/Rng family ribonuclease [Bacteroidales bacterium]